MIKLGQLSLPTLSLAIASVVVVNQAFAANFNITPADGHVLPTTVVKGHVVSAFYTVTNQTSSTRAGYTIQNLPATVTQNTSNPSYCQNPITLSGNASCTLQLDISGKAISSFELCKGSSCTTTAVPLHVVVSSDLLFSYVSDYSSNLWKCPMDDTGGISGSACKALTNAATPNFLKTTGAMFGVFGGKVYAYVSDISSSLWRCLMNATGDISGDQCTALTNATAPNFYQIQNSITFAMFSGVTYAYVSDLSSNLWQCPMSATGDISGGQCSALTNATAPNFSTTQNTAFATFSGTTYAYVSDYSSSLWKCPMNANGRISGGACKALTNITAPNFFHTQNTAFATYLGTTYAYVSDTSSNLWQCPMTPDGDISGGACTPLTNTPTAFLNTTSVVFGVFSGTTYAYVSDFSSSLWQCPMNATGGILGGSCIPLTNITLPNFKQLIAVSFGS